MSQRFTYHDAEWALADLGTSEPRALAAAVGSQPSPARAAMLTAVIMSQIAPAAMREFLEALSEATVPPGPVPQPIDTAPRTGRYVVTCNADGSNRFLVRWDDDVRAWLTATGTGAATHWIDDEAECDRLFALMCRTPEHPAQSGARPS